MFCMKLEKSLDTFCITLKIQNITDTCLRVRRNEKSKCNLCNTEQLLSNYANVGDIGMVQRSQCFSFTLEACQPFRITAEFIRQRLDGDFTLQLLVFGAIDFAKSTLAEQSGDF